MNESEAKSAFFAEVSAWGTVIGQSRAGAGEAGVEAASDDPAAQWSRATKILRFGRLLYAYNYLFVTVAVLLIILAIIGAILMAQKMASGARMV